MELAVFVYLAEILPAFAHFLMVNGFIFFFISLITWVFAFTWEPSRYANNEENERRSAKAKDVVKISRHVMTACAIATCISLIIPSQKTFYLMGGAYATQSVATSEVGKKTIHAIEIKINKYIEEFSKEKAK